MLSFKLSLAFGIPDPSILRDEMPFPVLQEWMRFYEQCPWGGDVEDIRAEAGRIRHLLCEFGDGSEEMPNWKWPYATHEDIRDPITIVHEMKAKELERREKMTAAKAREQELINGIRDSSTAIDSIAGEPAAVGSGSVSGSSFDPNV